MVPPDTEIPFDSSQNAGSELTQNQVSKTKLDNHTKLFKCCQTTIEDHGANNPMMVCSGCKQIIKRFTDQKAFTAYQKFCQSRHRKIFSTTFNQWHIVIFKSYETFTS